MSRVPASKRKKLARRRPLLQPHISDPTHFDVDGLTAPERAFVNVYLTNGHNATAAYQTLHPNASKSTCGKAGLEYRHTGRVDAAIKRMMLEGLAETEITQERILRELACLAFVDPIHYLNADGSPKPLSEVPEHARRAISGLDVSEIWEGTGKHRRFVGFIKKLGITNKAKALETLVRIYGMITEKHELSASEDLAALLTKARKRKRTRTEEVEETTLEDLFS
jgi:phage terminase small subunit